MVLASVPGRILAGLGAAVAMVAALAFVVGALIADALEPCAAAAPRSDCTASGTRDEAVERRLAELTSPVLGLVALTVALLDLAGILGASGRWGSRLLRTVVIVMLVYSVVVLVIDGGDLVLANETPGADEAASAGALALTFQIVVSRGTTRPSPRAAQPRRRSRRVIRTMVAWIVVVIAVTHRDSR